ncbi:MAG: YcgN family cysteine cluster protein [Pseudomonadota bacterium]
MHLPFWRTKTLEQMNAQEWEALCDGCGRCCLLKLEDEDTGTCHLTRLSCSLLDLNTCRCRDYANRHAVMPDCISIDSAKVRTLSWLPDTCAYRMVAEGRDLAWWHPLRSGRAETVVEAGIAVGAWAISESGIHEDDVERFIIDAFPAR